ncbi:hypothetical protein E4T56_gene2757 [Termitomyces sp. T112]|nr:hypothetical protein E4T56_gene2757 [Termitomyces sp. T112]
MTKLGWSAPVMRRQFPVKNASTSSLPDRLAVHWRTLAPEKKATTIEDKHRTLPSTVSARIWRTSDVRDRSKEWEVTIASVSGDFGLNSEQERAFRTVANHALCCTHPQEQPPRSSGVNVPFHVLDILLTASSQTQPHFVQFDPCLCISNSMLSPRPNLTTFG